MSVPTCKCTVWRKHEIKLFAEELDRFARRSGYPHANFHDLNRLWVYKDRAGIAAVGGLGCYHGHWCMRLCIVRPDRRGLGIQQMLIKDRCMFLVVKKVRRVNAWVAPSNSFSLNNLVESGFRFVKEKPRTFGGVEHYKMRKELPKFDY